MDEKMKVNMAKNKRGPGGIQCDQIGQFIGVWETFQCLWQQLVFNFSSEIIFGQLL